VCTDDEFELWQVDGKFDLVGVAEFMNQFFDILRM